MIVTRGYGEPSQIVTRGYSGIVTVDIEIIEADSRITLILEGESEIN